MLYVRNLNLNQMPFLIPIQLNILISVADPDPFDTDPDPAFTFDTDPDPAVGYGSGSLPFQRGNLQYLKQYRTFYSSLLDFTCQEVQQDPHKRYSLLSFPLPLILLCH